MNLLDSNVWLAHALSRHQFHPAARTWFTAQTHARSIIICRSTQQSFLRMLTTENIMQLYGIPAMSNANALQVMERDLTNPRFTFASEPPHLEAHWKNLARRHTASLKLWMDAYLAAFAIAGKYQLITTDKAFSQFKGLSYLLLSNHTSN